MTRAFHWQSLHAAGFSVFPLKPNTKTPACKWEPYQTERPDPTNWQGGPWNIGLATGAVSGIFVLDTDTPEAEAYVAAVCPRTLTHTTPRGKHRLYRHPGRPISNRANLYKRATRLWGADNSLPLGLDVRGDGGFVVAPGSYYIPTPEEAAKGKVAGAYESDYAEIADAPDWLLALLDAPDLPDRVVSPVTAEHTSAYGLKALHQECETLSQAMDGERNDAINYAAFRIGQLVAGGEIVEDEARENLMEALAVLGVDDQAKSLGTLERGLAAGMDAPRAHKPSPTAEEAFGTPPSSVPGEQPIPLLPSLTARFGPEPVGRYVGGNNLTTYFQGCAYIAKLDAVFLPCGVSLKKSAFDGIYGGPEFLMDSEGKKSVKSAWESFRTNPFLPMPKAYGTCFRPELAAGAIVDLEGLPHLNAYVPIYTPRQAGDASPLLDHVRRMLPNGQDAEYLLHWMAACVQNPGAKFQWWPVVQGTKGNGKTLLLMCMMNAVGVRYSHLVNPAAFARTANQFNSWIENKLFLGFEEIYTTEGQRDILELLKSTVTNTRIASEGKGRDQETVDNRANGMMLTNHKDGVPIEDDERRYGIFWCAQQSETDLIRDGMDGPYFHKLYTWLNEGGYAIVTDYLHTKPLREDMNPAHGLQRAPVTTSTAEAVIESLGKLEQFVMEAIEEEQPGFGGGFISSTALARLLAAKGVTLAPRKVRPFMQKLKYDWHPALSDGRVTNALADGTKPRLYVARGHTTSGWHVADDVVAAFMNAQNGLPAPPSNVVPIKR